MTDSEIVYMEDTIPWYQHKLYNCQDKLNRKNFALESALVLHAAAIEEKNQAIEEFRTKIRLLNDAVKACGRARAKRAAEKAVGSRDEEREKDAATKAAGERAARAAEDAARAAGVRRSREEAERQRVKREEDTDKAAAEEAAKRAKEAVKKEEAAKRAEDRAKRAEKLASKHLEQASRTAQNAARKAGDLKRAEELKKAQEKRQRERDLRERDEKKEQKLKDELMKKYEEKWNHWDCEKIVCDTEWGGKDWRNRKIESPKDYKAAKIALHPDKVRKGDKETRAQYIERKTFNTYWFSKLNECASQDVRWICSGGKPRQIDEKGVLRPVGGGRAFPDFSRDRADFQRDVHRGPDVRGAGVPREYGTGAFPGFSRDRAEFRGSGGVHRGAGVRGAGAGAFPGFSRDRAEFRGSGGVHRGPDVRGAGVPGAGAFPGFDFDTFRRGGAFAAYSPKAGRPVLVHDCVLVYQGDNSYRCYTRDEWSAREDYYAGGLAPRARNPSAAGVVTDDYGNIDWNAVSPDVESSVAQEISQEGLLCPISQDVMLDPVQISDGSVYERSWIDQWITACQRSGRQPTSPVTNLPLRNTNLDPRGSNALRVRRIAEKLGLELTPLSSSPALPSEVKRRGRGATRKCGSCYSSLAAGTAGLACLVAPVAGALGGAGLVGFGVGCLMHSLAFSQKPTAYAVAVGFCVGGVVGAQRTIQVIQAYWDHRGEGTQVDALYR